MSGHRSERVADRIRDLLAQAIGELRDPRIGFVTLTGVELSPDLRHARVFASILGTEASLGLEALNHAAPFLRHRLAERGGLRFTPDLRFVADRSVAGGARIERILQELHEDDPSDDPQ